MKFVRVQNIASRMNLRIVEGSVGEFIIGDVPVVLLGSGGQVGLRTVGLGNAASLSLPLGPKYLATLSAIQGSGYLLASADDVEEWNRLQIRQAKSYVAFSSTSGLAPWIVSVRPPPPANSVGK